jgi:hypothetical protein
MSVELKDLYRLWNKVNDAALYAFFGVGLIGLVVISQQIASPDVLIGFVLAIVVTWVVQYVSLFVIGSIKKKIGKCRNCKHGFFPHERKRGVSNPCTVRNLSMKRCNCEHFEV